MRKDQNGYIVVETIGCFVLFVMLMGAILSLINVVTLQARVHYAITQAVQTLSMYSYTLEVTGTADEIMQIAATGTEVEKNADELKTNINGVIDGIMALPETLDTDTIGAHGKAAVNQVRGWAEAAEANPKATMQLLMQYGLNETGKAVLEQILQPLVGRYLANGGVSGDAYLKMFGVEDGINGLNFYDFSTVDLNTFSNNDSMLLTEDGNVKICVSYDIDLRFFDMIIPFSEPKLHVTQEAVTKAWLGGHGEGYK